MIPIPAKAGEPVRLIQVVNQNTTITIYRGWNGTVAVNAAPTNQFGSFSIRWYDFLPAQAGLYLISWDGAPTSGRWELLLVSGADMNTIEAINEEIPPAEVG